MTKEAKIVSQIAAGPPMNPMVLAVAAFVIVAVLISFGNKRQRPILWAALFVSVIMVLFPPWVGRRAGGLTHLRRWDGTIRNMFGCRCLWATL